jgi:hypothetical protein
MNMKKIVLAAASILALNTAFAQNRIQDEFKDGMDESAEPVAARVMPCKFFPNVISIQPFQFTESGVGASLSWERSIDPEGAGYVSFYLPVIASFRNGNRDPQVVTYGGSYPYGYNTQSKDFMFYAMPGIKFYPTGVGKVKYSLGPSAVIGLGERERSYSYFDNNGNATTYGFEDHRFMLGMMFNNTLNFNPTPHLHLHIEFGFGFSYYDLYEDFNHGLGGLAQGNFGIGYRL